MYIPAVVASLINMKNKKIIDIWENYRCSSKPKMWKIYSKGRKEIEKEYNIIIKNLERENNFLRKICFQQKKEISYLEEIIKENRKYFYNTFLKKIIENISKPREQQIFKMRFGFENGKTYTLQKIGQEFSISMTRVRELIIKILEKIDSLKYY